MIRRLKIKFILLSMSASLLLLAAILAGINVLNYTSVVHEVDEILSLLSDNRGSFPDALPPPTRPEEQPESNSSKGDSNEVHGDRTPELSPEIPYESRYFSVLMDAQGAVISTNVRHIVSVDDRIASAYAARALAEESDIGFLDDFRYHRTEDGDGIRVVFLDCGRRLASFYNFLYISIAIAAAAFLVIALLFCFLADRLLRPIADSYEKQKRFVTDAGHEIKTPLTIINANADLLEMEIGENESLVEIQHQTRRLAQLTNELVQLARMEEAAPRQTMISLPLSELVREVTEEFRPSAEARQRRFLCEIQPLLSVRGNSKTLHQLVSILLDNAVKYTPTGGEVRLSLSAHGGGVLLTVDNTAEYTVTEEQLQHVFDRFYRIDESRNSATGGHGIGLSIAQSIVTAHGGRISAVSKMQNVFGITVHLPNK